MIVYEDECVGCKSLGLWCYGDACPNRNVPYIFCNRCGDDICDERDGDCDLSSEYHLCNKCKRELEEMDEEEEED